MVRDGDGTACWDEPVFRYLLAVEAGRARRVVGTLFVVVVDVGGGGVGASTGRTRRPGVEATGLAPALARCLRESDLVGWHRANRRAAALLAETAVDPETARLVGTKVLRALGAALPAELAPSLRVRVYCLGAPGARARFHPLFAAPGAAETTRSAVKSPRPAGAAAERAGAAAGGMPTNTSLGPRTAEAAAVSRRAPI